MKLQPICGVLAALLLTSCATIGSRVNDLATVQKTDDAFIVVYVDNQSKNGLLATPYPVEVGFYQGTSTEYQVPQTMAQEGRNPFIVYRVKPGTYRLANFFSSYTDYLLNQKVTYRFNLDKLFYTVFTVRPGEVGYVGSFLLENKQDLRLTTDLRMDEVKDALSAKNPLFEGYRWFSLADDRPSFF